MGIGRNRLYGDLAWLWPMWGDPAGEYADWCDHVVSLIQAHASDSVRTLLNLGCGGGKNACNLKRHFRVTGVDVSGPMLELATRTNPECDFVRADMRDCRLGREFDAVLVDDAVSYMLTREDLGAAFRTAHEHLRSGGVMVVSPDETAETFQQNRTRIWHAEERLKPQHLEVVFVENSYDVDPADTLYDATFVYLIRERGELRIELDSHVLGLFTLDAWRGALRETGFEVHEHSYPASPSSTPTFACVRR